MVELTITEKSPTICLNMIVKDESHIIQKTLEHLCSKINFSYWVISDTGSTDNTCDIIKSFFASKNIPGELHCDEWKDFSHNRNLALNYAFEKSDYLFFFDADDEIHGNINIPTNLEFDGFYFNFGCGVNNISYQRILMINNHQKWKYVGVLHEVIVPVNPNPKLATFEGDYYIVSGRSGSRNKDPEKYLKDAIILEKAFSEAQQIGDNICNRYAFYCANSYKDAGKPEEAIKWYKKVLELDTWIQEKYVSCLFIFNEYAKLNQKENGMFYLVESFKYDLERFECVFSLIQYYSIAGLTNVAYQYYGLIKNYYENTYLTKFINTKGSIIGKLFIDQSVANFYLPYFVILVADKVKSVEPTAELTIFKMYEIIFTIKQLINTEFYIGNLLYNLQFFIDFACKHSPSFVSLFQSYIDFLYGINFNLNKYDFLKIFEKYGVRFRFEPIVSFTQDECKNSNKILLYAGNAPYLWNYTYSINNSIGGSETAVAMLAQHLGNTFEVYVCGSVQEEKVGNVSYINFDTLKKISNTTPFRTVIVSRFINFYELFPNVSYHQSFIWGHDVILINIGCSLDTNTILRKWNHKITGCVCQTEWHKNLFLNLYPELTNKISIINNGISIDKFIFKPAKISNRFIYTSCTERGLDRLLELWPQISESIPDAELFISTYNDFPRNVFEQKLKNTIDTFKNVNHVGKLNKNQLYELMSTSEYWLYPTSFDETSCITAMEMLMSEVICLYYPRAGLMDTLGDYGLKVERGNEIETILGLTTKYKYDIKKRGKEYAVSCDWKNRSETWKSLLFPDENDNKNDNSLMLPTWCFYYENFTIETVSQFIYNQSNYNSTKYNIVITNNENEVIKMKPVKFTFIYNITNANIFNLLKLNNQHCEVSILQTEPLNITWRLNTIINIIKHYPFLKIYDYSKSNIKILNKYNIKNCEHLPYNIQKEERTKLLELVNKNKDNKIYDFGFIYN